MIQIINNSNDPAFNLAMEEYFLKQKELKEDILIFWVNKPTIVIGKNQNAFAEINQEYVEKNEIQVVRRLSGGGAVYHDFGNLNFTVIKANATLQQNDFSFFTKPIIQCLIELGLDAKFSGRNDIMIDDRKISGNAQYFYKNRVLHHGTLLYNSDLTVLANALKPSLIKIKSKGISSVRSHVGTISQFMQDPLELNRFVEILGNSFKKSYGQDIESLLLSKQDIYAINELANHKYRTWKWTYGTSPEMNLWNEIYFPFGTMSVYIEVREGIIKDFRICGDFFEGRPIKDLEDKFTEIPFSKNHIEKLFNSFDCSEYIKGSSNIKLMQLIFERSDIK